MLQQHLSGKILVRNDPDRAQKSVVLCAKYNAIFMTFVTILFVFFAHPIIQIFSKDPALIKYGTEVIDDHWHGLYFLRNRHGDGPGPQWCRRYKNSYDDQPGWLLAFQVPLGFLLSIPLGLGPTGSFIAIPIAETLIALIAWYYFRKGNGSVKV